MVVGGFGGCGLTLASLALVEPVAVAVHFEDLDVVGQPVEHALRLSPRDRLVGTYASLAMAWVNFAAGHYPECVTWARSMIEKSPGHTAGHFFLTAALALEGELTAAAEARGTLLRLRPEFSLTWMTENMPPTGEVAERLREGLRKAGVPEA